MKRMLTAVLLLASASLAQAEFNYNYVSASFSQTEFDDINIDGNAFGFGGSFAISDEFHVFGNYGVGELDDDFGVSADVDQFSVGFGYNVPITPNVDVVATASYEYVEVSVDGFGSADDNGYGLGLGLRLAASEQLELHGGMVYVDFGDDDTGFGAGLLYNFTPQFALGVDGDWTDDTSSYGVTGRLYFGR